MADDIHTIPEILRYWSEHQGDKESFTFCDRDGISCILTPREIYTLSGKFASCLRQWGFHQGDVIANGLPNSPERLITDLGIIVSGCSLTNCQVLEKDGADFYNTAQISQCCGVILCPRNDSPVYSLFSPLLPDNSTGHGVYDVSLDKAPSVQKIIICDRRQNDVQNNLLEYLRNSNNIEILQNDYPLPSSLAVLFATSGSSGFSKLIPLSHAGVLKSGRKFRAAELALYFTDRPMGWVGGFPFDYLAFGSRRVVQDKMNNQHTSTPGGLWNIISTHKCTGAALLPHAVYELIDHFQDSTPEHKLQFIASGGQPMKKELIKAIGLLCHAIVVSYGSTEGGIMSFDVITNESQFKDFYCGKVMADVQVKMVDTQGKDVNFGQTGDILLKCDRLVKEYYNASGDVTKSVSAYTQDGWFLTGDRGILESDNTLYCFGRKGDVISFGSTLVYLSWPENILNKCPAILDASVIGIDEENGNAKLCACVVPKRGHEDMTESEVIGFFKDAVMANDEMVKLTLNRVFIMEDLPLLPSGKVNKRRLRKHVLEKLETV